MTRKLLLGLLLIVGGGVLLRWAGLLNQGFIHPDQATYAALLRYRDPAAADTVVFFARPALYWALEGITRCFGWASWSNAAVSAAFGSLTVALTAWWGRRIGGAAAALVASGLVAFSASHLLLSRIGIGVAESGFFATAGWFVYAGSLQENRMEKEAAPFLSSRSWLLTASLLAVSVAILLCLKAAAAMLYPSKETLRILFLKSAVWLQGISWLFELLTACLLWRLIRRADRTESCQLAGAGLLAGIAVLWHYTALWLLPISFGLSELWLGFDRASFRPFPSRGLRLGLSFLLPVILAQGIGFPNRMYWKELAGIIGANINARFPWNEPAYYLQVLWNRDGTGWTLLWLGGLSLGGILAFRNRHPQAISAWLAGAGIFGFMSLTAALGGLAVARGIGLGIPPVAVVTGWAVSRWFGSSKRAVPLLLVGLVGITASPHLLRILRTRSGFETAVRTMGRTGTDKASAAYLKSPSAWIFYLGPQRAIPLTSPLPGSLLSKPIPRLPAVRFVALDQVTPNEVELVMGKRRPIAVIPNPQERLQEIICEIEYGAKAWRSPRQRSRLGQILIFDLNSPESR